MTRLRMIRGDAQAWDFAIVMPNGQPQTLVGATLRFTTRARLDDAAPAFTRTVGTGITVTDALGGLITVRLAPTNTSTLVRPTTYYWDLEVTDGGGNIKTVADGTLEVRLDVSQ